MADNFKKELRRKLKETPESKLEHIINLIGLYGVEKEIAYLRYVKHKSVIQICMELNISESTYHRNLDIILKKINYIMNDSTKTYNIF